MILDRDQRAVLNMLRGLHPSGQGPLHAKGLGGTVRRDVAPRHVGRERTARHEAGHAVVGALLGLDLSHAVVEKGGGGAASFYTYASAPAALAMAMAGSLAECGNLEAMSEPDREIAHKQARAIVAKQGGSTAAALDWAERSARFILRENHAALDEVAAELERRGKLYGSEIIAIVERHRGKPLRPEKLTAADTERNRKAAEMAEIDRRYREAMACRPALIAEAERLGL